MKNRVQLLASTAVSVAAVMGSSQAHAQAAAADPTATGTIIAGTKVVSTNNKGTILTTDPAVGRNNPNVVVGNQAIGDQATQTVYSGFNTVGGTGSGGGAGLGGVFFVDSGTSLQLTNVSLANNSVTGGQGGGTRVSSIAPVGFSIAATTADASAFIQYDTRTAGNFDAGNNQINITSLTIASNPLINVGNGVGFGKAGPYQARIDGLTTNEDGSLTTVALSDPIKLDIGNGNVQATRNGDGTWQFGANSLTAIQVGQAVVGTGIPDGVVVKSVQRDDKFNVTSITTSRADGTVYTIAKDAPAYIITAQVFDISRVRYAADGADLSDTLTSTDALSGFLVGQTVTGIGVPDNTLVTQVTTALDEATGETVTTVTLSEQINLRTATNLKASSSPLVSNVDGATLVVSPTIDLRVGQTVSGVGIAADTVVQSIAPGNNGGGPNSVNIVRLSKPLGQAALNAIKNNTLLLSVSPVLSTAGNTITLVSVEGYAVGDAISGGGIGAGYRIKAIDAATNTITYEPDPSALNPALAPANAGGSMNGLIPSAANPGALNGVAGVTGTNYAATYDNGEGSPGTNGGAAKSGYNMVGGTGGAGGSGSNASSTNKTLITSLALDVASLAANFIRTDADAAGIFTLPSVPGDIAATIISAAAVAFDSVQLDRWRNAEKQGLVALGGNGGQGGNGGNGSAFFGGGGGGVGGAGGRGAESNSIGGAGGAGGQGGTGGFGAGGGNGGDGGAPGPNGLPKADGLAGVAGFGGGTGSSGGAGGQGGSGFGGAIFVRGASVGAGGALAGGSLTITGNAVFQNNVALAGSSNDGGLAGSSAGADLFMMTGAKVMLAPGIGKTITFYDSIADDSSASIGGSIAAGRGAQLNIGGGGTVQLFGTDTYTGATNITGATLQAQDGVGIHPFSQIRFSGAGTIGGNLSTETAGVLLSGGTFTRPVGTGPANVTFTGSGGFAGTAANLVVNLGTLNAGAGPVLVWGAGGFVPIGKTLIFGSDAVDAVGTVTLQNGINLAGTTGAIAVYHNIGASASYDASITGAIGGGALLVGDVGYGGTLLLSGQNSLVDVPGATAGTADQAAFTLNNGVVSTTSGDRIGRLMNAATGGSVLVNGGTLKLGGPEKLKSVQVAASGTLLAAGAVTADAVINLGITGFGATLNARSIENGGVLGLMGATTVETTLINRATGTLRQFAAVDATIAINDGRWTLGGDLTAPILINNGEIDLVGIVSNGTQRGATRTIHVGGLTGTAASTINLGGIGDTVADTLVIDQSGTSTYAGIVNGAGSLTKTGAGTLTLTGVNSFAGDLTVGGGTLILTAANGFGGRSAIASGATLSLTGAGAIAASSGVTANGLFTIAGTAAGASIKTLAGTGAVDLGAQRLTLTAAGDTFAGVIGGTGGVTVAGGSQALGGANSYTGASIVGAGATLRLVGAGSIAASAGVVADGTLDIAGTTTGASITTLSGSGTVALGGRQLTLTAARDTFAGAINGTGGVRLGAGNETLTGVNGFTGPAFINGGATLLLAGGGSIAAASTLVANGRFDIAGTAAGASVTSLDGVGTVGLGARRLTLTNANATFSGVIDGSGGVTVAGGVEQLAGVNLYTGRTLVANGATLGLRGTGSIAASAGVTDDGVFAIDQTTDGARIATLDGGGRVVLGSQRLTLIAAADRFDGTIEGTGGLSIAAGSETLGGIGSFTGRTIVDAGATLSLADTGSIAASSGVTANGRFDIGATAAGASIATLSGTGTVALGARQLTLTAASETFDGVIDGSGGLTVAGGVERLGGVNVFTGRTVVNTGATLGLVGLGSIARSAGVTADGLFAIDETANGAAIASLAGGGTVVLGDRRLALVAAADRFDGTIGGAGGIDVVGGEQVLTGVNTYTGLTAIAPGATLLLAGSGSLATSAGIVDDGRLDVGATTAGARVTTLSGGGTVALGDQRLTLTAASGRFDGAIGGRGGLTIAAGTEQLAGVNGYTGTTLIDGGATLALIGTGSIAASSGVAVAGTLAIGGTADGAAITTLSGTGLVDLGARGLTLSAAGDSFAGEIRGTGGLTVAAGRETLTGVNSYTGQTIVASGATLVLMDNGSIARSAGVTDAGVLSLADGAGDVAIVTLGGTGAVDLGARRLILTDARDTFAGVIGGTGGLTVAGGAETLSGVNTYAGPTIVAGGATLALAGTGSIESSSRLLVDGGLAIGAADAPVRITTLAGGGQVALGGQSLLLTTAADTFGGTIGGAGGLTVLGGTQTLTGVNRFTGRTTVGVGATLALAGTGGVATSSGVTSDGTFSIAGTTGGASIQTLSGTGLVLLGDQRLTLTNASDTFGGLIGGTGGVTVAAGAETLSGLNDYTGRTEVAAGALLVLRGAGAVARSSSVAVDGVLDVAQADTPAIRSLAGAGSVVLGGANLRLTNASDSFAGSIGGAGGVTVTGGAQTLSGANGYTGRTTIDAGARLALAGNGSLTGSSGVGVNGTFDLVGATGNVAVRQLDGTGSVLLGAGRLSIGQASGTFAGSIAGPGSLAILGGTQTLTGASSFGGGTTVRTATLAIGGDASLGAATGRIALDTATLRFLASTVSARGVELTGPVTLDTQRATVALGGVVTGAGTLIAAGGGTLALGGANSYAGGTQVIGGTTLRIGADGALGAAAGTLSINDGTLQASNDFQTGRTILIAQQARFDGAGRTIGLDGPLYGLAGNGYSVIATGGLRLTGVLDVAPAAGGFTLQSGATLRGTGSFARAMLVNGTLAPGNSPGTMTFSAPVTIGAAGTLSLDIDGTGTGTGAGNYSRIIVTGAGNTFTAGGTLRPVLRGITGAATNNFTPAVGQSFVVVQTPTAVAGSFARIDQPTAGLAAGTRFDATYGNNVTLFVTPGTYANLTPNGTTLTDNEAAIGTAIDALRGDPGSRGDPATAATLAAIYPLTIGEVARLEDQLDGGVYGDVLRASAARSQSFGRMVDAQADGGARGGGLLWMTGYGQNYDFTTSLDRRTYGLAGGVGVGIGEHGLLGIAGGYDTGKLSHRASGDSADVDLTHLVAYGAYTGPHAFARFHAGATRTDVTSIRLIPQLGTTARGRTDGWGFTGAIEAGYLATAGGWSLIPTIGVRSSQVQLDSFAESGAGPVSLVVEDAHFSNIRAVANLRVARDVPMSRGGTLRPQLDFGYLRELDDRAGQVDVAFAGAPSTRARIRSVADGRDGFRLGGGLSLTTAGGVSVFARGELDTQANVKTRSGSIGLGYRW